MPTYLRLNLDVYRFIRVDLFLTTLMRYGSVNLHKVSSRVVTGMKCQPHLYASNWSIMSFVAQVSSDPVVLGLNVRITINTTRDIVKGLLDIIFGFDASHFLQSFAAWNRNHCWNPSRTTAP